MVLAVRPSTPAAARLEPLGEDPPLTLVERVVQLREPTDEPLAHAGERVVVACERLAERGLVDGVAAQRIGDVAPCTAQLAAEARGFATQLLDHLADHLLL